MIVNFQFNMPEDKDDLDIHLKAKDLYCAIWDYDQYLRTLIKYQSDSLTEEQEDILQKARDKLWDTLKDKGLSDIF